MLIQLYRNKPSGKALFGQLLVDCENVSGFQSFKLQMDTLENTDYAAMLRDFFLMDNQNLWQCCCICLYTKIYPYLCSEIKNNNK